MNYKKIILLILIVIWMGSIFIFSNQRGEKSSNTSGGTINFILKKLPFVKDLNEQDFSDLAEKLQLPVRKLAHFTMYAIGGVLFYMLFNEYNLEDKNKLIYSFCLCLTYAILDEVHQCFVPGRSAQITDVLIDSVGSILAIIITKKVHTKKV